MPAKINPELVAHEAGILTGLGMTVAPCPALREACAQSQTNPVRTRTGFRFARDSDAILPTQVRRERMSYTIGFQAKDQKAILATEAATANQAVAIIAALRQSADEIKFIRSPQEGEMGIEMLLLLAKEEAEEMPQRV
ncbi:hypothetical protein ACQ5SK_47970 [Bradyrhizobium japonicum]